LSANSCHSKICLKLVVDFGPLLSLTEVKGTHLFSSHRRKNHVILIYIEDLSLKEVPGRLAAYLLYLSEKQGRVPELDLDVTKGQLASLLGTAPETLSRILARMGRQDLIRSRGGASESWIVLSWKRLPRRGESSFRE